MSGGTIRIKDLPEATGTINTTAVQIPIDSTTTQRTSLQNAVNAASPIATQGEAEAGTDNAKRMTSLRVRQATESMIGAQIQPYSDELTAIAALPGTNAGVQILMSETAEEANSVLGVFETEADFAAATIDSSVTSIQTKGYYSAGDGGGHQKVRISTPSPVQPWHKQSADGAWWEVLIENITPKVFGAVGDGIYDCTSSFEACGQLGDFKVPRGTYSLSSCFLGSGIITFEPHAVIRPINIGDEIAFDGTYILSETKFYEGFWFNTSGSIQSNPSWGYIGGVPTVEVSTGSVSLSGVTTNCQSVSVVNSGSGGTPGYYQALPITGGGGTGGTARVWVSDDGEVTAAGIQSAGSGYTSEPSINLSSIPGLSGADLKVYIARVNNSVSVSLPSPIYNIQGWINPISSPTQDGGQILSLYMCPDIALSGQYKFGGEITPENFGAVGDGVENDAPIICMLAKLSHKAPKVLLRGKYMIYSQIPLRSGGVWEWTEGAEFLTKYPTIGGGYITTRAPNDPSSASSDVTLINPTIDASGSDGENGIGIGNGARRINVFGGKSINSRISPSRVGGKNINVEIDVEDVIVEGLTVESGTFGLGVSGTSTAAARRILFTSNIIKNCDAAIFAPVLGVQQTDSRDMNVIFTANTAYNCGIPTTTVAGGQNGGGGVVVAPRGAGVSIIGFRVENEDSYGVVDSVLRGSPTNSNIEISAVGLFRSVMNQAPVAAYFDSVGTQPKLSGMYADISVIGSISYSLLASHSNALSGSNIESGNIKISYKNANSLSNGFVTGVWASSLSNYHLSIIDLSSGLTVSGLGRKIATDYNSQVVNNEHVIVGSIKFSGIPTSSTGLTSGDVWRNGNVLNIV